jgi:geranylgeranyl diphosphate synthase, type I
MSMDAATSYFAARRGKIAPALEALAARRASELSAAPGGAAESLSRVAEFCLGGKMIRGSLAFLGAEAGGADSGGGAQAEDLAALAAAMELFQAGLLAHDDIMDRDETRRGAPTVHARYAEEASGAGAPDALHVGEALGICLGDLCYFEAFAALAGALEGHPLGGRILALCSGVLSEVALAQMADVRWGAMKADVPEAEILALYRCKTARYSFSLPLAAGALYAGAEALVAPVTELGERLGILFQIRDDELGLFGETSATGKGLASDLREGKKTLFRARLLAAAPTEELPRLRELFAGGADAGPDDLRHLRRLAGELGVDDSIAAMTARAEEEARAILRALPRVPRATAEVLEGLVDYVTRRDR